MAHATAEVQGGEIVGISQGTDKADTNLGSATSQDAAALREELVKGEKVVVILGEGKGAVAQASLIGIQGWFIVRWLLRTDSFFDLKSIF